jgi:AraC-like DNA-binding protein
MDEKRLPPPPVVLEGLWTFTRPPGFRARARATAHHLVHLVDQGGYELTLSGRTWRVAAPMLIWYHGGEAVAWHGDGRGVRFRSCAFSCPALAPPPSARRCVPAGREAVAAFAALDRAAEGEPTLRQAIAVQVAACRWLEAVLAAFDLDPEAGLWERVEQRALRVGMRARVADLARWAGVGVSTLERSCRARHGCPPGMRLRALRSAQAAALLAQGGMGRAAVAAGLGYSDRRSLRRAMLSQAERPPGP